MSNSSNVIGQLKDRLLAASQDEITRVLKEAQAEALQEAKELLKQRMLEAILNEAINKVSRLTPESSVLVIDDQAE